MGNVFYLLSSAAMTVKCEEVAMALLEASEAMWQYGPQAVQDRLKGQIKNSFEIMKKNLSPANTERLNRFLASLE